MIMTWTGTRLGRGLRNDVDKNFGKTRTRKNEEKNNETTRKRTRIGQGEGLRKD
jgi:hypothetical protein